MRLTEDTGKATTTELVIGKLEKFKSIWDTMQLVDVELEKHMESRTSTNSPKFLSHSIEEILKKPSSLTVQPDRTDKKLKTSGCTQTKTKTDAPKISQCTGVFSVLFWSFIVN